MKGNPVRVWLDVGGCLFATSEATVRKSSTLAALFDECARDDVVFVDRDPVAFSYILMFLRSDTLHVSRDVDSDYLVYLMQEASYFGLRKLEALLVDMSTQRATQASRTALQ